MKKTMDDLFGFIDIAKPDEGLANLQLPSPDYLSYYKNLQDRIITLYDNIDIDTIYEYIENIIMFNKMDKDIPIEERKPIKIRMSSYGGDVDAALAFVACVEKSKTPVYTYNMGVCMSAAAIMFLSGHKRFAMPNSQYLLHQGYAKIESSQTAVIEQVEELKKNRDKIRDYVMSKTKIDKKTWTKAQKSEWYISVDECVELGIADKIVDDIDELY